MSLDSADRPRVLFAAFAEVPGPSSISARLSQLIASCPEELDVDAMTLKGRDLAHIQRLGFARMMRVPTHEQTTLESLGTYTRALNRQLASDQYQLVVAADVFSAATAAAHKEAQGFTLILEVGDLPSETLGSRHDLSAFENNAQAMEQLKAAWHEVERAAFKGADLVLTPSRPAAKHLSHRVDARKIQVFPRAVDRAVFSPSAERLAGQRGPASVMILGAREAGGERQTALAIARRLVGLLPPEVELVLAAQGHHSDELARALEGTGLDGRVRHFDIEAPLKLAKALNRAEIVVVPARHAPLGQLGIPHRILEAMACGSAVVLDGPPALVSGVVEPGDGIIVAHGEIEGVADAVIDLVADDPRRHAIANAGFAATDRMDLADRLETWAKLIGGPLGITVHPRMPETTLAAVLEELVESSVIDVQLPPEEEEELSASSEAAGAEGPQGAIAAPVATPRFSSDRLLSQEGGVLGSGEDLWQGQTEVLPEEAPPPSPPPRRPTAPTGKVLPNQYSTETDLRPLVTSIRRLSPQSLSSGAFQAIPTAEQPAEDATRVAASEVGKAAAKERAFAALAELDIDDDETYSAKLGNSPMVSRDDSVDRAGQPLAINERTGLKPPPDGSLGLPTSIAVGAEMDTEAGLDDPSLHPRSTDPSLSASVLSESTIRSLIDEGSPVDDWAPDTVFDARPVFQSQETGAMPEVRGHQAAPAEVTHRNPTVPGPSSDSRGKKSLLVDDEQPRQSESGEG